MTSRSVFETFFSRQFIWEIIRIIVVGIASLLFYLSVIPLPVLLAAMAFGLYSLVKTAFSDFTKERKIGTELFITIAVIVSVLGKEYPAGADNHRKRRLVCRSKNSIQHTSVQERFHANIGNQF
jgi:hypothetical protein